MARKRVPPEQWKNGRRPNRLGGEWTEAKALKLVEELIVWLDTPGNWYIDRFCVEKKIPCKSFAKFPERFASCKDLMEVARDKQRVKLVEEGMEDGRARTQIFRIFAAKNIIGFSDKQEGTFVGDVTIVNHISRPGKPKEEEKK